MPVGVGRSSATELKHLLQRARRTGADDPPSNADSDVVIVYVNDIDEPELDKNIQGFRVRLLGLSILAVHVVKATNVPLTPFDYFVSAMFIRRLRLALWHD